MELDREKIKQAEQLSDEEYEILLKYYRPEDKDFTGPVREIKTFDDLTDEEKDTDDHLVDV